jgi:hypothetical protein
LVRGTNDSVSTGDACGHAVLLQRAIGDSWAVTDHPARTFAIASAAADGLSVSDAIDEHAHRDRSASDAWTASDQTFSFVTPPGRRVGTLLGATITDPARSIGRSVG